MEEKNESPRTENGTRTFSNRWVVTDNGKKESGRRGIDPIKFVALVASTISLIVSILVRCGVK